MFFKPEDALKFHQAHKQEVLLQARAAGFKIEGGTLTIQAAQVALDYIAEQAVNRIFPWWKALRPHDTIEAIKNFKVPDGDYSVGLEHECNVIDDDSIKARRQIVDFLKQEDYVCIDSDGAGGRAGAKVMLEATFPPVLASTIGLDWAGCRYVDFIGKNKLVVPATPTTHYVGVHINMAKGSPTAKWHRYANFYTPHGELNKKYFGRAMGFSMACQGNGVTKWIEFRMFNTTEDPVQLLWYVRCAQTLIDLIEAGKDGDGKVYNHLEEAYNKFFNVNSAVNYCRAAA